MAIDQAQKLRDLAGRFERQRRAATVRQASGHCRVITVASGKGGVGKTNLVLNLGLLLAKMNYRVVVFDADLGLANVDLLLNVVPRYNLADVLSGAREISEIIVRGPLGLKIVPGGSGVFELANLDREQRRFLLDQLRSLEEEGDVLLIDTAAGLHRSVLSFIAAADDFILLTTPEPAALTDAYGVLKVISEQAIRERIFVVINFTKTMPQGEQAFARLERVAGRFLPKLELVYLGEMRFDPMVGQAAHNLTPFVLSHPRCPAALSLTRISWRLVTGLGGGSPSGAKEDSGFINRLKQFLSTPGRLNR
jgi:flagellar biosynthesis protein FlhG